MSVVYNIYSNGGSGGPVDFTTPLATTAALSASLGPLSPSSDYTFAVRPYDTVTGLERPGLLDSVRVVTGHAGEDRALVPRAPLGLAASWGAPAVDPPPSDSFLVTELRDFLTDGAGSFLTDGFATGPTPPADSSVVTEGGDFLVTEGGDGVSDGVASGPPPPPVPAWVTWAELPTVTRAARAQGYRVYLGPYPAGPVDYTTPVLTVPAGLGQTFYRVVVPVRGSAVLAVRAYNASGEELNTNAVALAASAAPSVSGLTGSAVAGLPPGATPAAPPAA